MCWTRLAMNFLFITGISVFFGAFVFGIQTTHAASDRTWDGEGTDGTCGGAAGDGNKWSCAANWSANTVPIAGDSVFFSGVSTKDATIDAGFGGSIERFIINAGYSGIITVSRSLAVTAAYSQAIGTINCGSQTISVGTFTLSGGTFSATTDTMTVLTRWTHTAGGTFTHNSGTVKAVSNGMFPWDFNSSETFGNFELDCNGASACDGAGSGIKLAASDNLIVEGTLTLTDGTIEYTSIDGGITAKGDVTLGSDFDSSVTWVSKLTFAGTSAQNFNVSGAEALFNGSVVINNASGVTLNSYLTLDASGQDLTLTSGALNIASYSLTVADDLTYGGGTITNTGSNTITVGDWIQSTGTFDGSNSAMALTTFTLSGGTFSATTGTMTVAGAWTHTVGGTFTHNSGTVKTIMNAGSAWNFNANETFGNFEVDCNDASACGAATSGVTLAVSDNLIIEGSLTLTDGTIAYTTTDGGITAKGDVTVSSGFDSGTNPSKLTFAGTGAQNFNTSGGEANFNANIVINNAAGVTLNSYLTLDASGQDLTLTSGSLNIASYSLTVADDLNINGGSITNTGGNTITANDLIQTTGTFNGSSSTIAFVTFSLSGGTFNASTGMMTVAGAWTHTASGTFTHNSGTVKATMNAVSTWNFNSSETFGNFEVDCNGASACGDATYGVSLPSLDNLIVEGTLALSDGMIEYPIGATDGGITAKGDVTIGAGYDIGDATHRQSKLTFAGTSAQNFNTSGGEANFNVNIVINNAAGVTLNSYLTLDAAGQDLTLTSGALNIASYSLTVADDLNINGGSIVNTGGNTITANDLIESTGAFDASNSTINFVTFTQSGGTFDGSSSTISISSLNGFVLSGGTFTASSGIMTISGNWTHTAGGTFTASSGTVIFNGTSPNYNVATTETFYNVEINLIGDTYITFVDNDTMVVSNDLTLTDGKLDNDSGGAIVDVRGDINQAATFDGGTATLNFGDDAVVQTYTIAGGAGPVLQFDDADDANDSVVLSTADATLYGLTITAGFGANAVPFTYNGHNLTIGGGVYLQYYSQAAGIFTAPNILTLDGAYFSKTSGTFEEGTGTVVFLGARGSFQVTTETFYNVEMALSNGVVLDLNDNTMVVSNTLTLTDGKVSAGIIDARGNIYQAATFDGGGMDGADLDFGDDAVAQTYTIAGGTGPIIHFDDPDDANDSVVLSTADAALNGLEIEVGFGANIVPFTYNGHNLTIDSNDFIQRIGIFNAPAILTLTNSANFTKTGGTFVEGTGKVIFSGTGTAIYDVATTETFYDVEINKTTATILTITSGDTMVVSNNLTLTDGDVMTGTFDVLGNVSIASTYDSSTSPASLKFSGSNTQTFDLTGATGLYNGDITVAKSGGAVNLVSDLVMDYASQDLIVQQGTLDLNGYNLTVQGSATETLIVNNTGNLQLQGGETITPDSASYPQFDTGSTITYDGTSTPYTMGNWTYTNTTVVINGGAASVFTLPGAKTFTNLTITSGTMSLNGNNPTVSSTFSNLGTLRLWGSETFTGSLDVNSGTIEFVGDDDDAIDTYTITTLSTTYNNLIINSADGATDTFQLGAALDVDNDLTITAGTFDVSAGNYTITIGKNFANSGTFNGRAGIVTFDDVTKTSTVSGSTTFYSLTCNTSDKTVLFTTGSTQEIDGVLTVTGTASHEVIFWSTANDSHWNIKLDGTASIDYIDVRDSDASTGSAINPGLNSTDSGNNDNWQFQPIVDFTSASQSGAENAGTFTITAQLSYVYGLDVTVPYTITGTATGSGTDYSITASPITVTAGNTTGDITITVVDDVIDELSETVIVTMGSPTNGIKGTTDVHTATITDNDAAPTIAISDTSVSESVGSATITVTMTGGSYLGVTVDYATASGTAISGTDFTAASGTLTWAADATGTKTFTVAITDDAITEVTETINLTLSSPTNATISDDAGLLTIAANDPRSKPATSSSTGGGATVTPQFEPEPLPVIIPVEEPVEEEETTPEEVPTEEEAEEQILISGAALEDVLGGRWQAEVASGGSSDIFPDLPEDIAIGSLVKLSDDGDPTTQFDSAVYFIGTDERRHPFPNESVYKSWFPNFYGIRVVEASTMSNIQLGPLVTYRPGSTLIKFPSIPKVYAIDSDGVLHWITSEEIAIKLYGYDWNKIIVDVSEAFWSSYTFGDDLLSVSDQDWETVIAID